MPLHPGAQKSQTRTDAGKWTDAAVELRRAKKLESEARTRKLDLDYAAQAGTVWQESDMRPYYGRVMGSLRVQLMELPELLADRLNPADPAHAAAILEEAIRRVLDATVSQLESYVPPKAKIKPRGTGEVEVAAAH
jgi:hypothetical protein